MYRLTIKYNLNRVFRCLSAENATKLQRRNYRSDKGVFGNKKNRVDLTREEGLKQFILL